jgi:hypothetical protein
MIGAQERVADTQEHSKASIPVRANTAPLNGKGNKSSLPDPSTIIIAEWPKNAREIVRVDLHEFNRVHVIGARVWYRDDADEIRPGKSGLTLSVKHLPALADAIGKALARAIELGLVEGQADR